MSNLFKNWDEPECISAWDKLRETFTSHELLYVFYGALLKGDLNMSGSMVGLKKHNQHAGEIEFEIRQAEEVAEGGIKFHPRIKVSDIQTVTNSYKMTFEEMEVYEYLHSKEDRIYVHTELMLCIKEERK